MDLSRRRFLSGVATTTLTYRLGLISGVLTATSVGTRPANAWIMAAIAIGSVVAGAVAEHNRGDGGLGAILEATNQKLTLIIETLAGLQRQVATVLEEIAKLPGEVDAALRRDDVRKLQRECRTVLNEYLKLLKVRENFETDKKWMDDRVRADLRSLLERLQVARGNLRTDGAVDPTSALVVSSVAFLEHSLMNLLGYRPVDIRVRLETEYLPWFADIVDPRLSNSAQTYVANAASRHKELMKAANESPVGRRLGMKIGVSVLNACVGVNDYIPSVAPERVCDPEFVMIDPNDPKSTDTAVAALAPDGASDELRSKFKTALADVAKNPGAFVANNSGKMNVMGKIDLPKVEPSPNPIIVARQFCQYVGGQPERPGARDRYFQNISLVEEELQLDGKKTGIMALKLVSADPERKPAGPAVPADPACKVEKLVIHDEKGRLAHMQGAPAWVQGQQEIAAFNKVLDDILTERSRASFGLGAIAIAETSKAQLVDLLARYR